MNKTLYYTTENVPFSSKINHYTSAQCRCLALLLKSNVLGGQLCCLCDWQTYRILGFKSTITHKLRHQWQIIDTKDKLGQKLLKIWCIIYDKSNILPNMRYTWSGNDNIIIKSTLERPLLSQCSLTTFEVLSLSGLPIVSW